MNVKVDMSREVEAAMAAEVLSLRDTIKVMRGALEHGAFIVESMAHLQGMERALLPVADEMRNAVELAVIHGHV